MTRHIWTPEEDAQLREMLLSGLTYRQAGERFNTTREAIAARAKRLGIKQPEHLNKPKPLGQNVPKQARFTPEQQVQILQWANEGFTIEEIANRLGGFSVKAMQARLKRMRAVAKRNGWQIEIKMTRQDQVAERLADGMTFAEIAADLCVSENAVEQAFKKICRNLGEQAQ